MSKLASANCARPTDLATRDVIECLEFGECHAYDWSLVMFQPYLLYTRLVVKTSISLPMQSFVVCKIAKY
jgi:hypothetical protein